MRRVIVVAALVAACAGPLSGCSIELSREEGYHNLYSGSLPVAKSAAGGR